jgi:hypothetical protein
MAQEYKPVFIGPSEFDKAVQAHAGQEPRQQYRDLPGGITNGEARLVQAYFGVISEGDQKGKKFFRALATVMEPKSVTVAGREVDVYGLQTSIMIVMADRKKADGTVIPAADAITEIMDVVARLGGGKQFTANVRSMKDLEGRLAILNKTKPKVRFSTREGKKTEKYPNPKVFHTWYDRIPEARGAGNGSVPSSTAHGVVDYTAATDDDQPGEDMAPATQAHSDRLGGADDTPPFNEGGDMEPEANLDDLASQALGGDADAGDRLQAIAREAGIEEDVIQDDDTSWFQLVELIREAHGGGASTIDSEEEPEPEPEPEVTPVEPETGKTVKYRVILNGEPEKNARGKIKPAVDCKIVKVHKKARQVDLKEISGDRTFRLVPWDQLIVE